MSASVSTVLGAAPHLANQPWLTRPATQAILAALENSGFEARVIGGAVRNALFGLPVSDIDIATTAQPGEVMRLATAAGFATVPTGIAHGTVTVIVAGSLTASGAKPRSSAFEVTTLRTDVTTDGRHATVAFTTDWAADASRRDFTINGLSCDRHGRVHDPLGGYPDIVARRVRFIGDARQRIAEDYLRILRFFRFTARYSVCAFDATGIAACVLQREGLARLSGERVRQELLALMLAPRAVEAIERLRDHGLLGLILPVAPRPTVLQRLVEIEAAAGVAGDPIARLAALAVSCEEDADRLAARLRMSAAQAKGLISTNAMKLVQSRPPHETLLRAALYRAGADHYRRAMALQWAATLTSPVDDPAWRMATTLPDRWSPPTLPIKGADVLAAGVAAGPAIGVLLREIESWWVARDFAEGRVTLLARLTARAREIDRAVSDTTRQFNSSS